MKTMLEKLIINKDASVKEAIRAIMENGCGCVFLTDENGSFVSVITDGDIRKAILSGKQIADNARTISNKDPLFVRDDMSEEDALALLRKKKNIKHKVQHGGTLKVPVVDGSGKIVNVLFVSLKEDDQHIIECDIKNTEETKKLTGVKSVLITGGAGYLGSILCRKLLDKNYKVRVLDNLMYGDESIRELYGDPDFELIKGDIRNLQTVVEAIKGVDAAVHLAAIVGDPATTRFPQEAIDVNYLATKVMAEACKYYQVNRFIFASTCSVYGESIKDGEKLTTSSRTNPVSLYAKNKLESEKAILSMADGNFFPIVLRMATLYGLSPRMRFDLVVNQLTAEAVVRKKINIFGGKQWRPFLHVSDAAGAYIKCLELPYGNSKSRILNIGTDDQNYRIDDVGKLIKDLVPDTEVNILEKNIDIRNYKVLFNDSVSILGFNADMKVSDGISEIRDSMEGGSYSDYKDPKYSNVSK
ncbi:MAG: NAD-dependent epimerase/dehydratase family protein [Candidatus Omnitrophota bacterium]